MSLTKQFTYVSLAFLTVISMICFYIMSDSTGFSYVHKNSTKTKFKVHKEPSISHNFSEKVAPIY